MSSYPPIAKESCASSRTITPNILLKMNKRKNMWPNNLLIKFTCQKDAQQSIKCGNP